MSVVHWDNPSISKSSHWPTSCTPPPCPRLLSNYSSYSVWSNRLRTFSVSIHPLHPITYTFGILSIFLMPKNLLQQPLCIFLILNLSYTFHTAISLPCIKTGPDATRFCIQVLYFWHSPPFHNLHHSTLCSLPNSSSAYPKYFSSETHYICLPSTLFF